MWDAAGQGPPPQADFPSSQFISDVSSILSGGNSDFVFFQDSISFQTQADYYIQIGVDITGQGAGESVLFYLFDQNIQTVEAGWGGKIISSSPYKDNFTTSFIYTSQPGGSDLFLKGLADNGTTNINSITINVIKIS